MGQLTSEPGEGTSMHGQSRWLTSGLFLTTLATLLLELLDSRLLSVLTWYHLSFLSVSLAMLGMAAGAVLVFLAGDRIHGQPARRALAHVSYAFALAIPATHLFLVRTRLPPLTEFSAEEILPLVLATVTVTIPFLLSGAVVTIALTRVGGRIGILYGADLIGASIGCLLIVPLLHYADIMSASIIAGALAAGGALCFARFATAPGTLVTGSTAVLLALAALGHL